jgi:hypothetical protein
MWITTKKYGVAVGINECQVIFTDKKKLAKLPDLKSTGPGSMAGVGCGIDAKHTAYYR